MTATAPSAFAAIDAVFDRCHATAAANGVVFGVMVDGELGAAVSVASLVPAGLTSPVEAD